MLEQGSLNEAMSEYCLWNGDMVLAKSEIFDSSRLTFIEISSRIVQVMRDNTMTTHYRTDQCLHHSLAAHAVEHIA